MYDCPDVDMREALPELLHDQLDAPTRARVEAHLATCADCAAELDVLRGAQIALRAQVTRTVNVAAIVAALPAPRTTHVATRNRSIWRVAAALTVVALGGLSVQAIRETGMLPDSVQEASSIREVPSGLVALVDSPASGTRANQSVTAGVGLTDIADEDLEELIGALDRMEAAPYVEPDTNRFGRFVSGTTGGR